MNLRYKNSKVVKVTITSGMLEAPVFSLALTLVFLANSNWHVALLPLWITTLCYFLFNFYGQIIRELLK